MQFSFKKIILSFVFNTSIFLILIIGIQNSSNKGKVNFVLNETINLPMSFIIGTSFISGSVAGTLLSFIYSEKN